MRQLHVICSLLARNVNMNAKKINENNQGTRQLATRHSLQ